ncbi:ROK family transcriptional regulator [Streptomyces sp. J2-1]|uniref:ROK family transcriptional regulator n=1 Tax=Streptomyces corallincola TaxID=2851888 RepID=UPI001C3927A8|nr:ROK family transcriptional regulator [Streptomyces corallincola]
MSETWSGVGAGAEGAGGAGAASGAGAVVGAGAGAGARAGAGAGVDVPVAVRGGGSGAGANLLALRSHNAALVLNLLRTAGRDGISRLELAERTGLTPQAVSKITARLREDGLAAEAGRRASTGGKPRTVLRLVPEAGHAVGVHLDRDELRAVVVDLDGSVRGERCAPVDLGAGADTVVGGVAEAVRGLVGEVLGEAPGGRPVRGAAGAPVRVPGGKPSTGSAGSAGSTAPEALAGVRTLLGVGVALPGPLDHTCGVLHRVTGFPAWDGYPLRDALADRLGIPVAIDKDTNAAALGLALDPSAPAHGSFAYLHLGTGLGASLVIGGTVHRGARTGAGEFGHQVLQLDGPLCSCGNRGCVEALCLAAAGRGDVPEAARVLGVAAGNLVGLLDIDLILLGGRMILEAPDTYVQGVREVLEARAWREGISSNPIPVRLPPRPTGVVAEGAAQLLLGAVFGRGVG